METDIRPPVTRDQEDLLLNVRVSPGAGRDNLELDGNLLKLAIKAPPVDGKANQYLKKYLGKLFGVPQSRVTIEKGETSKNKSIRITGPRRMPAFIDPV